MADLKFLIHDYVVKTVSSSFNSESKNEFDNKSNSDSPIVDEGDRFTSDSCLDQSDDEDERCDLPYGPSKTPCISGRNEMEHCDQEECPFHIGLSTLLNKSNYVAPPNCIESTKEMQLRKKRRKKAISRYRMSNRPILLLIEIKG